MRHAASGTTLHTLRLSGSATRIGQTVEANLSSPLPAFVAGRPLMGGIDIGGIPGRFGPQTSANLVIKQTVIGGEYSFVTARGSHLIKGGALVEHYKDDLYNPTFSLGIYAFGNLEGFLRNTPTRFIGLTPEAPRARNKISNEAILEKLKAAIAEHGENLSETRFCELTKLSGTMLSRRFGTWGQLRQLAGLAPRAQIEQRYTDQEIIDDIFQVVCRCHCYPSYGKYKSYGGLIAPITIRDRFGSWLQAKAAFDDYLAKRFGPVREFPDPPRLQLPRPTPR